MNLNINQLFPNLSNDDIYKLMRKYNIKIPENYTFSDINIVIGPNGCGKTRFLNLIKEAYYTNNSNNIIYGYFPSLSDKKNFDMPAEDPDYTLFDTLSDPQATFNDFLTAIEKYSDNFIVDLLHYLHHQGKVQRNRSRKALATICNCFHTLTNKEIQHDNDNIVVINQERISETLARALELFSPGELMLFYISIFIALQNNSRNNKIIILDEPECHLHPEVLIKFIEYIYERDDYSTIWIATHSLFLIPKFEFKNVVLIKENAIVSRRGDMYAVLISEMLGKYNKNMEFFASLSQWQFSNYIAECFTNPDIIDNINPYDEQVQLFVHCLNKTDVYRILDFGGGSARLGLSLKELLGDQFLLNYKYSIYDPKPTYKGKDFKIYNNLMGIQKTYDCVVMMNVLHEISPNEWVKIFNSIRNLLKNNGFLMFVETSILSKGELPNSIGYLVLGSEELKILFNQTRPFSELRINSNQKSICTIIPKSELQNITSKTVIKALKALEKNALNQIKLLRSKENDPQNIRKYAFYSQLYLNAKLFNDSNDFSEYLKPKINSTFIHNKRSELLTLCDYYSETHPDFSLLIEACKKDALIIMNLLENRTFVPENIKEHLWHNIVIFEEINIGKNIIVLLLTINSIAGHNKSKNRLENQYLKYLP